MQRLGNWFWVILGGGLLIILLLAIFIVLILRKRRNRFAAAQDSIVPPSPECPKISMAPQKPTVPSATVSAERDEIFASAPLPPSDPPSNTASEPVSSAKKEKEPKQKSFCPYCGKAYKPGARFCGHCGKPKE